MKPHPIARLKRFDERRESLPGEHWLTLAAGIALWVAATVVRGAPVVHEGQEGIEHSFVEGSLARIYASGYLMTLALVVALVSGNGARATALRRQVRHTGEVAWGRAMAWPHTFVVSIAATIIAVVILLATDLPVFWNLLLVVVAVVAGIAAWFSSRPDEAMPAPSVTPAPTATMPRSATDSTDGAQAPVS